MLHNHLYYNLQKVICTTGHISLILQLLPQVSSLSYENTAN